MIPRKLCVSAKTIMLCIPVFLLLSCQNPAHWYPEAEVSVSGSVEYVDQSGARGLTVTLLIHNSSDTSIISSVLTVKALTDKREYLHTVSSSLRIIPDGTIALTVSIPYLEADEQLKANGVSVYDAFFE
jgi:hypothetical protein